MVTEDLDQKAKRILEAVWKAGSEADTSEIREYTGLTRGQIQYRVDGGILEEEGLVESRLVSASEEGSGSIRVTSLTERGDRIAGRVMDEGGSVTLDKEVETLREDVQAVEDLAHRVDGHLDAVEERMADVEADAQRAVDEALEDLGSVGELEDLIESAREIEEQYEEVVEENRDLREQLSQTRDIAEALTESGLLETSRTDHLVASSDLARFRVLAQNDVFARLVEAYTSSDFLGLDGEPTSLPELPDVSAPTVEVTGTPTASLSPEAAEQVERLHESGGLEALVDAVENDEQGLEVESGGRCD